MQAPALYSYSAKVVMLDTDTRKLSQKPGSVIQGRRVSPRVSRAFARCKEEMDAWVGAFSSFANSGLFNCYPIEGSVGYEHWAIQLDKDYRCILSIDYDRAGREEVWIRRLEYRNNGGTDR